ncbi:hypothetical protein [Microbacterium sp. NPDC055683]
MNAAGVDLMSALGNAALALGIGAVITAMLAWNAKRRGSRSIALDVVLTLTAWFVVVSLLSLGVNLFSTFTNAWIEFSTTAIGATPQAGTSCGAAFATPASTPMLTCVDTDQARVTIEAPTTAMRWGLAGSQMLSTLALVAPFCAVAVVAFHALGGRPFHIATTHALTVGAAVVVIAGFGADALTAVSETLTLRAVLDPDDAAYPPVFRIQSDLLPLAVALVMLALAAVFRHGARLQGENALLRDETARLQRDTEGLV